MNRVTLMGRVGADPEIRTFQSGEKVANMRLATSERWKDKQTGEKKEATEWHTVAVFGPVAEVVEKYVHKGDQILVEGKLQTRKWQDQSGQDRYSTEVVVRAIGGSVHLIGGKRDAGQDAGHSGGHEPQGHGASGGAGSSGQRNDMDDEIPF